MYENRAEMNFSFGKVTYKVWADGNIDRPQVLVDHLLATATAVTSVGIIQHGICSDGQRDDTKSSQAPQKCSSSTQFGEITVGAEIGIESKQHISNRTLNSLVFSTILPKIQETAGAYLGEHKLFTSPPSPLTPMPETDVNAHLSAALGLGPIVTASDLVQSSSEQSGARQLVDRARHLAKR